MEGKSDVTDGSKRQCHFFVNKRKRFCRLIPGKGKRFCGEHCNQENTQDGQLTNETGPERIPCPYDSHHTVAVKQLDKHLKVCNSRPKDQPVYYQKGINAGTSDEREDLEGMNLASFSVREISAVIAKVETTFSDHVPDIKTMVLEHPTLSSQLGNPDNGPTARKHLVQISSLLGHMTRLGLLGAAACFVEFGAGRGRLTQWVQEAVRDLQDNLQDDLQDNLQDNLQDTAYLLVDRAAVRHKRDNLYQRGDGRPAYERINMDIENLCMGKVPAVCEHSSRPIVAYTKHLCGAATDLALRCLMETRGQEPSSHAAQDRVHALSTETERAHANSIASVGNTSCQSLPSSSSQEATCPDVKGVVMAMCCHHRCSWRSYVGKQFLRDCGFSEREFMAVVRMSSWATCGTRVVKDDEANDSDSDKHNVLKDDVIAKDTASNDNSATREGARNGERQMRTAGEEHDRQENPEGESEHQQPAEEYIPEKESIVGSLGLSVPEREEIGFQCKRVLDQGRVLYLESLGLKTQLLHYVQRNISPENAVIISTPIGPPLS